MLLNSLPENYENFKCAIEARDDLPDIETLKIKILEEFETKHQKDVEDQGAMAVKPHHKAQKQTKKEKTNKETYRKNSRKSNKFKCYECGKIQHRAADCYFKKNENKYSAKNVTEFFFVKEGNDAYTIAEDSGQGFWCLDSGCIAHLRKDKSKFIQINPINCEKLSLATNASAMVKASGNVGITTSFNNNNNAKLVEFGDIL